MHTRNEPSLRRRTKTWLMACMATEVMGNDSAGGGRIVPLYNWYKHLSQEGMKFDGQWIEELTDCKVTELADEAMRVFGKKVNITTEGKHHFGAVIGYQEYKDRYCTDKVQRWKGEIEILADIAKIQTHAAYIAFTKAYKSKFTYFMRTI